MKRYAPPVRQQALLDDMAGLVHRLQDGEDAGLSAFGATDVRGLVLRLAGTVSELIRRHPVDDSGRCRQCRRNCSGWRRWLRWPARKAPCLVLSVASFYSTVPAENVWLQLLSHLGINPDLREIRAWLANGAVAIDQDPEPSWPSVDEPNQPGATAPVPVIPLPSVEPPGGRRAMTA